MLRLLKIEWNKIYYYKTARIFTILYFIMLIIIGVFLANFEIDLNGMGVDFSKLGMFNFPIVWQNITWFSALAKIFIAVIIITNITNEYSNRTLKQNLIDGLSKNEFLLSKILTNLFFAITSTVFVFFISLILGFIFTKGDFSFFQGMGFILAYFIKLFYFFSICLFLAILVRKSAFALLSLVVLQFIEIIFLVVELLIRKLLLTQDISNIDGWFFNYLPLSASYNLIGFADFNPMRILNGQEPFMYSSLDWQYLIVSIIYTAIFLFLSFRLLKKRDL